MLKLENLKLLYLKKCENIAFDKSIGLNLKILHLEKMLHYKTKRIIYISKSWKMHFNKALFIYKWFLWFSHHFSKFNKAKGFNMPNKRCYFYK